MFNMSYHAITRNQYLIQYLMLTDRFIRNAKQGLHADEGGLYLQVYASGKRAFVLRDQSNGKQTKKVIGHYPAMSLAEARDELEKIKTGKKSISVKEAWNAYYDHLETQFRDPIQTYRMFKKDVLPHVSGPLVDIDRAGWVELTRKVVKRGSPVMANRLLTQIKRYLEYCKDQGWLDTNPLDGVKRSNLGGKEKAKDRNLSWEEIEAFLHALPHWGVSPGTKWALIGCLLTGQRATEVLTITDDGKTVTKMDREHQVPMTPYVRLWLRNKPSELPRDHRVLSHALRREKQDFTPHDLRRTYASRLADLGVEPYIIEKLLDHQMVGVMAVYNRATYWPERVAAQRRWEKALRKKRPQELGSTGVEAA